MDFEWDGQKSQTCYQERGFDFAFAARAFFDPGRLVREDARYSYGESRYQLLGKIEGRLFVVIYPRRRNVIRIISARKGNQREVKEYEVRSHGD